MWLILSSPREVCAIVRSPRSVATSKCGSEQARRSLKRGLLMATSGIDIEIDRQADAGHIRLLEEPV